LQGRGQEGRRVLEEELQGDRHAVAHLEAEREEVDDGEEGRLPAVSEQREEEDRRFDGDNEDEAAHRAHQALVRFGEELRPGERPVPGQGEGDAPRHAHAGEAAEEEGEDHKARQKGAFGSPRRKDDEVDGGRALVHGAVAQHELAKSSARRSASPPTAVACTVRMMPRSAPSCVPPVSSARCTDAS